MIKCFCDICGGELENKTQANAFITILDPETGFCKKIEIMYFCDKCLDKLVEVFNIDKEYIERYRKGEE